MCGPDAGILDTNPWSTRAACWARICGSGATCAGCWACVCGSGVVFATGRPCSCRPDGAVDCVGVRSCPPPDDATCRMGGMGVVWRGLGTAWRSLCKYLSQAITKCSTAPNFFFQNGTNSGFETCFCYRVPAPLAPGVPTKPRLESSVKKFKPHDVCKSLNHMLCAP